MQGEVFVPYTGIGGSNINSSASTFSLGGSTFPGEESQSGNTVNTRWEFPGGIINKGSDIIPDWGYALKVGTPCNDEDIINWLQGNVLDARVQPTQIFSQEDIEKEDIRIIDEINQMLRVYVNYILRIGDYDIYRQYYDGCVYWT